MKRAKNSKKKLIIILCPYPSGGAPSQRFRYEQYLDALVRAGYRYQICSFIDLKTNRILYQPGHTLRKAGGIAQGFLRRIRHLFISRNADAVLIHREATPLGPPWVEWIIAKILRKPIIYDFDDAIWLEDQSGVNSWVSRLKWRNKVAKICRWSYKVSVGNAYLADFVRQHNTQVVVNPTTIDTNHHHNTLVDQSASPVTIGWTGSHSTLKYLDTVVPVLQRLSQSHNFRFIVIANRPLEWNLPNLDFIQWKQDSEINDLMRIHIGIMPLPDDAWSKGKCGFKALQYMALGIPAVVSPVGVNKQMVNHGEQGFLCHTEEEWYQSLEKLLVTPELRKNMGRSGRQRVEQYYSVQSNTANFLALFS
uniref:Glycosyltransferase family 4 protein n=1 Tax=Roseihalotalea indica TaxID=2867963 RepID=A0AA49GLJ4_9BACT|nr:glycosyltransferase family 4 protein [Tunicatimonas sp. TK19036]